MINKKDINSEKLSWLKLQNVIYYSIFWSVVSLIFYLIFSVTEPDGTRPMWYRIGTYILQDIPLVISGLLCLRNWVNYNLPTGRRVWLCLGLSMFSFMFGNILFSLWELVWHLNPSGSAGDFFFVLFYVFLIWAIVAAIRQRQIKLKFQHWFITTLVGMGAIGLAMTIFSTPAKAIDFTEVSSLPILLSTTTSDAPVWVLAIDELLEPIANSLNFFYIICDVILLIFATIMIFAFWGGRLGRTWQFTAQAVICFYIADMWFAYASNQIENYQSGFIIEIFWIFGIIQFGIAAVLEFDNNLEARRIARRKQRTYHES